jgi:hypothetical protein
MSLFPAHLHLVWAAVALFVMMAGLLAATAE